MHFANPARAPAELRRAAFTLIEVLVVVAIIALLVAILIPSLHAARRSARSAACLANLKSLGSSMTMYAGAHKGWLPVGPADRIKYIDPNTRMLYDQPGPGLRPYPAFSCAWGGKRAKYPHDFDNPPKPETLRRPLTDFIYHKAGLDDEFPLFRCPDDLGVDKDFQSWIPTNLKNLPMYEVCGNSYWNNPWDANKPISKKRYNIPSAILIVEEAPMLYSMDYGRQVMGWHGRMSRHNLLFLDFHAANLFVNPTGMSQDPHRWQGPGWYAPNYFEVMDYYR